MNSGPVSINKLMKPLATATVMKALRLARRAARNSGSASLARVIRHPCCRGDRENAGVDVRFAAQRDQSERKVDAVGGAQRKRGGTCPASLLAPLWTLRVAEQLALQGCLQQSLIAAGARIA